MAAGLSRRFEGDKLAALYRGRPLIDWALDAVPPDLPGGAAVVSNRAAALQKARQRGFMAVYNGEPERGVSHTIRLGIEALTPCDALLFMVADQPRLTRGSVEEQIGFFLRHPGHIVAMGDGERRGNPVLFPARYFPELCALQGDRGGGGVIAKHEEALLLCPVKDPRELLDVDSPRALADLQRL